MQASLRDPLQLLALTGLDTAGISTAQSAINNFPVKVPESFIHRIEKKDPADPLLRQVLPLTDEDEDSPGFSTDPLHELSKQETPGLIRKYQGRVLLISTAACAIHCRYCFRRHYPYSDNLAGKDDWRAALDVIRNDESIHEVILSGGDPFSLSDDNLRSLIHKLEQIPHLKWLRIHSRIPVVLPARITPQLISMLTQHRFNQTLVVHTNHPREISADVVPVLHALHAAGIQLLNQSVLLYGVNDDPEVLTDLSKRLYDHHVLPYYLHMLDPVQGTAHFQVSTSKALKIMHELRTRLPGYLVPRLVREVAGEPYKKPVEA
jgi:EF-P beta-lysylation protein EpmB